MMAGADSAILMEADIDAAVVIEPGVAANVAVVAVVTAHVMAVVAAVGMAQAVVGVTPGEWPLVTCVTTTICRPKSGGTRKQKRTGSPNGRKGGRSD
jgi:uncharacterized membrane protein YgcG